MAKHSPTAHSRTRAKLPAVHEPSPIKVVRESISDPEEHRQKLKAENRALLAENESLKAESAHAANQTAFLQDIVAALLRASTVKSVAESTTSHCWDTFGCRSVAIFLSTVAQDGWLLASHHPPSGSADGIEELRAMRDILAVHVRRTSEAVYLRSASEWRVFFHDVHRTRLRVPGKAFAGLPITGTQDGVTGVLVLSFSRPHHFPPDFRSKLRWIADLCGIASERAQAYDDSVLACSRAEQANRRKDEFLAVLSHELRTPIVPIVGWASMLAGPIGLTPERQRIAVDSILRNAKTLNYLIEDLLDTARIASGRLRLEPEEMRIQDVALDAVQVIRQSADAKKQLLNTEVDDTIPPFRADPKRLRQVLWNLLSNSVKFTQDGGRIALQVFREDTWVRCIVSDDGEGIDPEFLPQVFERFRQEQPTQNLKLGLGLGLSIVRQLVELHGGSVSALSKGKGHGCSFCVRLPLTSTADAI